MADEVTGSPQTAGSTGEAERRRAAPRRARLQAGAEPGLERVLQLRDLVHDHLDPRRLLHDLRPGLEQRRPDRDLDRLAADLDPDPDHRLLHVGAGLRLPDRGRHLLVGRQARRPGLGLVHRLVQPDRPGRRRRLGRLRLRDLPQRRSSASTKSTSSAINFGDDRAHPRRDLPPLRAHPAAPHDRQHLREPHLLALVNNISVWWHVLGVAVIIAGPDLRPRQPPERQLRLRPADQQHRLRRRRHGGLRSGSTCCRSASC